MNINSTRFGALDVPEDNILKFCDGIPGFPEEKKFAFLSQGEDSPFAFLQSIANPDLTFVIVEPFSFIKDYTFNLADELVSELELSNENPPHIFNIVTVRETIQNATVNLVAPIVVNWHKKIAAQIILEKTSYTTRQPLLPNGLPKQASSQGGR